MQQFDVVIIGSGMGGLLCGDILSKEGYSVCVIEKNKQVGGSLQTYTRDRNIFDAGVHYLGGLAKGQNLYQVFQYLGIMDKLKLERMDVNAFDKILIGDDEKEYSFAQGYENFIQQLVKDFPAEEEAIKNYCAAIKNICSSFPLYNLRSGGTYSDKAGVMDTDASNFIASLTNNKKLQEVLASNNFLYAGQADKTPFYVHAMIVNSYIESAWKCIDGGSQIAQLMAKNIRSRGGVFKRDTAVVKIDASEGNVTKVLLADGSEVYGKYFISNLHPVKTMEITESQLIKNVYRKRLQSLENGVSVFMLNIVLQKDVYPYQRSNYYYADQGEVWNVADYTEETWPKGYGVFFSASGKNNGFASSITILTYMKYDEVKQWETTFNTVSAESERGSSYDDFKKEKAEKLLDKVEQRFPGLKESISSYYTATPLSYRDYIGTDDGSMYGIVKDYKDPVRSFISARTKVPNLYLTGQNLHLHGILGATMSGLVTCIELMGNESIIEKIKNA